MARPLAIVLLGLVALASATRVSAQMRRETEPVMVPPSSMSVPDGPFALALNPAALTGLAGWNVAYVHTGGPNDDEAKDRGDAGYAAMPLPFGFAAALAVDHRLSGRPFGAATQIALGGAYGHTPRFGVGFAVRHIEGGSVDGATTVDLSLIVRRSRIFAFSLVGYDVLGPARLVGLDGLSVPANVLGAFTVRPHGDDYLTLEAIGGISSDGRVGFGGFAGVGLPRGGRVVARTTVEHFRYQAELRVQVGAELPWDRFSALGGAVVGDGYEGSPGWYAGAIVGERDAMSLPGLVSIQEIVVTGRVDSRALLHLVETLLRAANDRRVGGVLLKLHHAHLPLAYAQELRQAIETVRTAEKPVVCHLGRAGTPELYACAGTDRAFLRPGAELEMRPPAFDLVPVDEVLAAAGLEADVVARGTLGPGAYAGDEQALAEDARARVVADIARRLEIAPREIEALLEGGSGALAGTTEAQLVAGYAGEEGIDEALEDTTARRVRRRTDLGPFGPRSWARPRRVGVVVADDAFVDGTGGEALAEIVEELADDRAVGAIVVRVDSPGGSLVAAERIAAAVRSARRRKPVVASVGARATSGAYLIAAACDEVFVSPASVTGGLALFFARLGARGASPERYTGDEREALAGRLALAERSLIEAVAEDRSLGEGERARLEGGRLFSGDEAVRVGLADHLGGFAGAVARARTLGRVAPNVALSIEPAPPRREAARVPVRRRRALELERAIRELDRETALAISPAVVFAP